MASVNPSIGSPARRMPVSPREGVGAAGTALLRRARPDVPGELLWRLDAFNKFLLSASPVARITPGVGREACRTLGFSRMAFLRVDLGLRRARGTTGCGLDVSLLTRIREPFESSPWIEASVMNGRPAFTRDVRHGPAIPLEYVHRFGLGPLLCVPVTDSRGPVGAMLLDRRGEPFRDVSEVLMEVACAVGESIGLALEAAAGYGGSGNGSAQAVELTARERQMLRLLGRGLSNKEIASATGLSVFTVRDYVSSLLRCLGVTSRSAAVARGWESGLLGEGDARKPGGAGESRARDSSGI